MKRIQSSQYVCELLPRTMVYDVAWSHRLAIYDLPASVARGGLPQMAFGKEREECFGHDKDVLAAAGY
jgi:hypothetical protein